MIAKVTHDIKDETIEAKVRWFRSLSIAERFQNFCDYTELALMLNPKLAEKEIDKSITGRIQVLRKA